MPRVLSVLTQWRRALVALAILPAALAAQGTGTIRGKVTDAATRQPLGDVQVQVVGSTVGAITNSAGEYVMTAVPGGPHELRVRRIGFERLVQAVTVAPGADARVDFALRATVNQLDALVVTGTTGPVEKRTLGNSITQVNVAEANDKASIVNVTEALQSRTPGLTLMPGSGTPGAAAELRIRGAGSLTGYKPVVFIDGIRYNIEALGNFNPTGAGISGQSSQVTSALDMINPNDIESIEVLKGPAAATLYGAEASSGVIQIITKRGVRGQQRTRWTSKLEMGTEEWTSKPASSYLMCDAVRDTVTTAVAVTVSPSGRAPLYPGCQITAGTGEILVASPLFDSPESIRAQSPGVTGNFSNDRAVRTGNLRRGSLSLRGGGDRYSFYLGGDRDLQNGVFFNSFNSRTSGRANFTLTPTAKSDVALNIGYIQGHLRLPISDESGNALTLSAARWQPGRRNFGSLAPGWATIDPRRANAYNNQTVTDRLTIGGTVNYRPVSWFSNRFVAGVDRTAAEGTILSLPSSVDTPQGLIAIQTPQTYVYTLDYAGNVSHDFGPSIATTTSVGAQVISNQTKSLRATGTGLGAPDVTLVGTATTVSGFNSFSEFNSVGYYIQEQVGWNNRLFLIGAVRADDHSSFGTNFNAIIYPKLSLSYIASEEPALKSLFETIRADNFKFRTAWGAAGRAPAPFSATQTYGIDRVTLGGTTGSAIRTGTFGNPDLRPERGTELEVGFDAGFLRNRLGSEFTYYNKKTTDMLVAVAVAPSSGFVGSRTTNLGSVRNTGVELGLTTTLVQLASVVWDTRLSLGTNKNVLLAIPDTSNRASITGQAYGNAQQNREGYPLGGYWASKPRLDATGVPVLIGNAVQFLPDTFYIGPSTPTRELSFGNTVTLFRSWRAYALLDHKGGHYLFNQRLRNQCQAGNDVCEMNNTSLGARNVTSLTVASATQADADEWKRLQYRRTTAGQGGYMTAEWIEPADFVKLREVSLTYTLPTDFASRMGASGANFTLAGRNLATWTDYRGADPEVNSYGGRLFARADTYTVPNLRRFTATLNFSF